MIKKITGYQVEGSAEIFDTIEEAEEAYQDIKMTNRYKELNEYFGREHPMMLRTLKIGDVDKIEDLISRMREFVEIRAKLQKKINYRS